MLACQVFFQALCLTIMLFIGSHILPFSGWRTPLAPILLHVSHFNPCVQLSCYWVKGSSFSFLGWGEKKSKGLRQSVNGPHSTKVNPKRVVSIIPLNFGHLCTWYRGRNQATSTALWSGLKPHHLLDFLPNVLCSQTLEKQFSVRGMLGPGGGRAGLPCGDAMGCHTEDIASHIWWAEAWALLNI